MGETLFKAFKEEQEDTKSLESMAQGQISVINVMLIKIFDKVGEKRYGKRVIGLSMNPNVT
jgi:hypothetical protein